MSSKTIITVESIVNAPVTMVWQYWTEPPHIKKWNNASPDWHTPYAESELKPGGKFLSRMEAKDGSFGFDFYGVFDEVKPNEFLAFTLGDGRKVKVIFSASGNETRITESFEAESENSVELQQTGWQAILDNFKKYTENNN